jgi:hypothetical protein
MADPSERIVKLKTAHMNTDDSHLYTRFPKVFNEVREQGQKSLLTLVQMMFDQVDDALFELADRAVNNAEQNMYFESMREMRIKRRGMEMIFGQSIKASFRQLTGVDPNNTAAEPPLLHEITPNSLSLVANEELEELVAVDSMVAKASSQFTEMISALSTRLDTLVNHQSVNNPNNPFGPTIICQAFVETCTNLELDIKAKLLLFKLFDRYVISKLDTVYQLCNKTLIDGGILPQLNQGSTTAKRKSVSEPQAQVQQLGDVFANLQGLLHQSSQQQAIVNTVNAMNGLLPAGQAPQIPRNNLMQLLHQVQQLQMQTMAQQQFAVLQGELPQQINVQDALNSLLAEKMPTKALSIGQVDDDSINLVAMLFQFILDDRNLAAPMKALIARLQIPLIKVAMMDKSFFSKGGHPARKLLNEVASACLGWTENQSPAKDPLYKKVESIVDTLLNDFDTDPGIFEEVLTDFVSFLEVDRRRAGLVEQRTLDAEDGKAKAEIARAKVQKTLNEKVAGQILPKVVVQLLEDAWSNVLFLICLKEGDEGPAWKDAWCTVDDLLWSVKPMSDAQSRQKLLKLLPVLLKSLRLGLNKISYNPFDMNQLFKDLEPIHIKQLSDLSAPRQKAAPEPVSPPVNAQVKSLDEMLDDRAADNVCLEDLDSELSAGFDLLDVMDQSIEDDSDELKRSSTKNIPADEIEQQYVKEIVVGGRKNEAESAQNVAVDDTDLLDENDPCYKQVDKLAAGSWIEICRDDNKKFRCRLAAIIRGTGKYIFVNRSGMKVEEMNRDSLALAIKLGAVVLLDEGLLFDRALESVIGNLRNFKAQTA